MRSPVPGGLALLLFAGPVAAQVRASLDGGMDRSGSLALAPRLLLAPGRVRVELTGEYRDFEGTGPAAIGRLDAGWFHRAGGPVIGEVTGTATGQQGNGLTTAGEVRGGLRLHLAGPDRGLWLGYQGGRGSLGPIRRWEAGLWRQLGPLSLQIQGWQTASVRSSGSQDSVPTFPDTLTPAAPGTASRVTSDLGVWLRWSRNRGSLAFSSGWRIGPVASLGGGGGASASGGRSGVGKTATATSTWWSVEGAWWLSSRVGLVGTVGRQPIDPEAGATGGRFLRLGFRANVLSRGARAPARPPASATALVVRRLSPTKVELVLRAPPEVALVEVMGDFSDWTPLAMQRAGDRWQLEVAAPPGIHRLNVRYDGGPWRAPAGTGLVMDEFGGEAGELTVP